LVGQVLLPVHLCGGEIKPDRQECLSYQNQAARILPPARNAKCGASVPVHDILRATQQEIGCGLYMLTLNPKGEPAKTGGARMERRKASEFDQELLNLFDQYVHGAISRRDFMDGAAKFAVGGLTAAAIFEALRPNYAFAEQVPKDDKRLKTEYLTFASPQGYEKVRAYLVQPAEAKGKMAGVLVVHENRGLNPYIEDVARRLGVAGYLTLAPDELTSLGGYPGDDEKGVALQAKLDQKKMMEDWAAAAAYLKSRPECTGKVGVAPHVDDDRRRFGAEPCIK